jgi:hypothetical protein
MDSSGYVKDGWQAGLWKIIPSGATNGTVGTTGDVTVDSAVGSVTVSGVFSADYRNYRILYIGGSGSADGDLKLTLGATTSGYYYAGNWCSYGGTVDKWNGSNAAGWLPAGFHGSIGNSLVCDVLGPFESDQTVYTAIRSSLNTTSVAGTNAGFLNNTTSYTAFTLTPSSGNITGGIIQVYGYN